MDISLRTVRPEDNPFIASLIRKIFREFGIDRPGTVYTDPTTDHLYELFQTPGSCYWIAEERDIPTESTDLSELSGSGDILTESTDLSELSGSGDIMTESTDLSELSRGLSAIQNNILGGCGIFPTPDLPEGCAELVKFYVKADYRGKGVGLVLMERCFESAREMGYRQLYLETLPELSKAVGMYERAGFRFIPGRLGESGHYNCKIWMIKEL